MTSLVQTSTWISRKPNLAVKHGLEAAKLEVTPDRSPTEKKAPTGELTCFCALGTHKACHSASESWRRACHRNTRHDCHGGKQECCNTLRHCILYHWLGTTWVALADMPFYQVCTCKRQRPPGLARRSTKNKFITRAITAMGRTKLQAQVKTKQTGKGAMAMAKLSR